MTITDALQLVPEYILLRPGAKLNRGTDEYIEHYAGEEFFHSCDDADDYADGAAIFRRPIPQPVREAMAFFIHLSRVCEFDSGSRDFTLVVHLVNSQGMPMSKIFPADAFSMLGVSDEECAKFCEHGTDPFGRWLLGGKV